LNRLNYRVVKGDGIANKGKTADFQAYLSSTLGILK
jgi:hypothetical protein